MHTLTNAEIIEQLQECKRQGREYLQIMRELVETSRLLRAELKVRLSGLEVEVKMAENDRENCANPLFGHLLDIH